MGIDWALLETESDMCEAVIAEYKTLTLSAGLISYTPIAKTPSGAPGLMKHAIPLNLDQKIVDDWFEIDEEGTGQTRYALSHVNDPIRRRMVNRIKPMRVLPQELLKDTTNYRNSVHRQWLKALLVSGVREAYSIPVFTGFGEYWSLSAMRTTDSPHKDELDEKALAKLCWIAKGVMEFCIEKLHWREMPDERNQRFLSPRELECLYWAAMGKSSVETADLLGITVGTVRTYLKQSLAKTNSKTKTQAVVAAYRLGHLGIAPPSE